MNDLDFCERVLRANRGAWVAQMDIVSWSIQMRGCGLTVHSRVSELRTERGLQVENKIETRDGRRVSFYRLLGEPVATGLATGSPNEADVSPDQLAFEVAA